LDAFVYGRDEHGNKEEGWEERMQTEAVALATGQFGPELLMTLGEAYKSRADLYLADELVGRYSLQKRKTSLHHAWSTTKHRWSLYQNGAKSLLQVKHVHDAAKASEKAQTVEDGAAPGRVILEQPQAVEDALDNALPTFLQTTWTAVVTDLDNTVKEVGRKLLKDKSVPWQIRIQRAQGMLRLGEIFAETGAEKADEQGLASMSTEAAKATLMEALAECGRDKKKCDARRRDDENPADSSETPQADSSDPAQAAAHAA
jgi:hypothetical protein